MKLPPQMKAIPPPRIGTPTSPPPPAAQPTADAPLQNGGGVGVGGNGPVMDDASLPPPPLEAQQTHLGNTVDATPPKSRAQTANGKAGIGIALLNGGGSAVGGAAAVAGVMDDDDDLPPPPPAITDESNYAVTEL